MTVIEKSKKNPPFQMGKRFLVQCVGYRGLAYQNSSGQWKASGSNKKLPAEVDVIALSQ
jgi:hypothetical protein